MDRDNDEPGTAVVKGIVDAGGRASYAHLDVRSESEWERAVARATDEFGRLDILVNNAGMGDLATIEETSLEDWERTVAIDQTGVFLGMKTAAAALAAAGRGSVVNVSSIFGTSGGFGTSPAYHAAKGAVRTLTKNTALHWADRGIRVNSVHPGFIDTPILEPTRGTDFEQTMISLTPMGRLGRPEEIARAWPTWPARTHRSSPDSSSTSTGATSRADGSRHAEAAGGSRFSRSSTNRNATTAVTQSRTRPIV